MEDLTSYYTHIPFFLIFVLLGIGINLLNLWYKGVRLTLKRAIREVTTGIWMSLVFVLILDNFVEWKTPALYAIGSIVGFLGSILVGRLEKDIVEAVLLKLASMIGQKGTQRSYTGDYTEGVDPEVEEAYRRENSSDELH